MLPRVTASAGIPISGVQVRQ